MIKINEEQKNLLNKIILSNKQNKPGYVETGRFCSDRNVTIRSLIKKGLITAEIGYRKGSGVVISWCKIWATQKALTLQG